jgi:hypothetical protein
VLPARVEVGNSGAVIYDSNQVGNVFTRPVDKMQTAAFHALVIDGIWLPIHG